MMPEYMVPEPWEGWPDIDRDLPSRDHAFAFVSYALVGVSDPTNVGDIPFWTRQGFSRMAATAFAFGRGFFVTGAIGYVFDPLDLRSGYDLDVPFVHDAYDWYHSKVFPYA